MSLYKDKSIGNQSIIHRIALTGTAKELRYFYQLSKTYNVIQNLEQKDKDGDSVLSFACQDRTGTGVAKMKYLLEIGASVNTTNNKGWNIGHQVCEDGSLESLKFVLGLPSTSTTTWNLASTTNDSAFGTRRTMLHWAAESNRSGPEKIDLLLNLTSQGVMPLAVDYYGLTALHNACLNGTFACVKRLVEGAPKALFMKSNRFNLVSGWFGYSASLPIDVARKADRDSPVIDFLDSKMKQYAYLK